MNPKKVKRSKLESLTDLPNIGSAMAKDLQLLGISQPNQLKGKSAYRMYQELCDITGSKHDLCVLDVFLSITDFIDGNPARDWWCYTAERKQHLDSEKNA